MASLPGCSRRSICSSPLRDFIPLLLLLLLGSTQRSSAQFTFTALEGISVARAMAVDSLGSDIDLVMIATLGELELQGFTLSFDLEAGTAMAWIYSFRSDTSSDLFSVAVVRLFGFQAFSTGALPIPATALLQPVTTSGDYADSDQMVTRLHADQTYVRYMADLPGSLPSFITLGELLPDELPLPAEFPLAQALWAVSFSGEGDSAMTCFVGTESGTTFCLRQPEFLSVNEKYREKGSRRLAGTGPNPVEEVLTISIDGRGASRGSRVQLRLYNSLGQEVAEFNRPAAEAFAAGKITTLRFNCRDLPTGAYHLLLSTPSETERLPLIIR